MPTARDVVTSAARTAKIIGSDEILDAADAEAGLFILNSMLQAWVLDGIEYTPEILYTLDDEVTVPDSFVEGTRYLLSEKMAVDFGIELDPRVLLEVERARMNLQAATNQAPEVKIDRMLRRMWQNRRWGRYGWFRG